MIITVLCNFYPFMTVVIKQINRLLKQEKNPPRYKKNLLIYPYINLLFVELLKKVYDKHKNL